MEITTDSNSTNTDKSQDVTTNISEEVQRAPRVIDQIGDRMKEYEKSSSTKLDRNLPFIVRIDGHHFSKFTKGFKRPFDIRIHDTMVKTTEDLLNTFSPVLGYTQSDEITLVFPECKTPEQTLIFGGKVQKMVSLMAGYASTRFNYHILRCNFDDEK